MDSKVTEGASASSLEISGEGTVGKENLINFTGFTVSISDGRGGLSPSMSNGKNFTESQKNNFLRIKSGTPVLFEKIKVTGAKNAELAFPRIDIP